MRMPFDDDNGCLFIDGENGELLWECDDWNLQEGEIKNVSLPVEILSCKEVSREI